MQLLSIITATLLIPVLTKMKLSIGSTLLLLGALAGLVGGLSPGTVAQSFLDVFAVPSTLSSVLTVIEIGMLSTLMDHYGLLKRMEIALQTLIPNPRLSIMLMPTMVGALQAPGGAALSASFVNRLGTKMGLTGAQRADINVISRHVLMLFAPFSVNMIIVQSLAPNVDIIKLGLLNLGFVIVMQLAGYFFILRGSQPIEEPQVDKGDKKKAAYELLLSTSPISIVILLNTLLKIPFPAALAASILLVFLLGDRQEFPQWLRRSFNPSLALLIIGVYFFQNVVGHMTDLLDLFAGLVGGQSTAAFLLGVAGVGLLFGYATGMMYLGMGMLLPIVAATPYGSEIEMLIHLSYAFLWCFIGYFFSPLHLCQLLSDRETCTTAGERYRVYLPIIPIVAAAPLAFYFLNNLLFR